jgi:hypothetical protein
MEGVCVLFSGCVFYPYLESHGGWVHGAGSGEDAVPDLTQCDSFCLWRSKNDDRFLDLLLYREYFFDYGTCESAIQDELEIPYTAFADGGF